MHANIRHHMHGNIRHTNAVGGGRRREEMEGGENSYSYGYCTINSLLVLEIIKQIIHEMGGCMLAG